MGNSLRDQLLNAGLVSEKQVKQAKKHQHSQRVSAGKGKEVGEAKTAAAAAAAEKAERDRALNKQRQDAEARKAVAAQIRQIIEAHRVPSGGDDVAYNFTHNNVIKRIYVSVDVHKRIAAGTLVIVDAAGKFELVTPEAAEKIRLRDPSTVVVQNQPEPTHGAGDDPYAQFKVPDDLMW